MKMKKRLLLLINLTYLGSVQANEIELQLGDSWAFDGGVFNTGSLPVDYKNKGSQLIIKKADGDLQSVNLEADGTPMKVNNSKSIIVDRTPPMITTQWQGVVQNSEGITVGPDSKLMLKVNEGLIKHLSVNDEIKQIDSNSYVHGFSQFSDSILVVAEDDFNNTTQLNASLHGDFEPPELSWQLQAPAIYKDNQWFGGKTAQVLLSTSDNTGVDYMLLNGRPFNASEEQLIINSGDNIQVVDTLGNTSTETISWSEDSQAPYIIITQDKQRLEGVKNIKVAVNEVFEIQTMDSGVGLDHQKYKGKYRNWMELPKKFRFTSKGTYRINVQSTDRIGNVLDTVVKVRVKR